MNNITGNGNNFKFICANLLLDNYDSIPVGYGMYLIFVTQLNAVNMTGMYLVAISDMPQSTNVSIIIESIDEKPVITANYQNRSLIIAKGTENAGFYYSIYKVL